MSLFSKVLIAVCLFEIGGASLLAKESHVPEEYKIKSGVVVYSISGGGVLVPELNLTIAGEGKLRFQEWGKVALIEEHTQESTEGTLHDIQTFTKCVKYDKKQQFDIEYDKEIILERSTPKGRRFEDLKAGMLPHGEESIAGRTCKVWAKEGMRICLYKGIPLLIEKEIFGILYEKKALWINEEVDVSTNQCTIPNFPIQKIALFKTTIEQKRGPQEISNYLNTLLDEVSGKESLYIRKHKRYYLNRLGVHIFERQKIQLPQILESMKRTRECLQLVEDRVGAKECIAPLSERIKQNLLKEEGEIRHWNHKDKEEVLDRLDEKITALESRMTCIRASKNITDLSGCMRK